MGNKKRRRKREDKGMERNLFWKKFRARFGLMGMEGGIHGWKTRGERRLRSYLKKKKSIR